VTLTVSERDGLSRPMWNIEIGFKSQGLNKHVDFYVVVCIILGLEFWELDGVGGLTGFAGLDLNWNQ
jgi:hypothetical protein